MTTKGTKATRTPRTPTTKRGRGRPPKAPEDKADITIHVRFTAAEIEAFDALLARERTRSAASAGVTRSSFVRGLVLAEVGRTAAKRGRGR